MELLKKNKPAKLTSLKNALKSWLRCSDADSEQMIKILTQQKMIEIKNQKVVYLFEKTNKIQTQQLATKHEEIGKNSIEVPSIEEVSCKPHLLQTKKYCDYLLKSSRSRPSSLVSLKNSIQAILKFENTQLLLNQLNLLKKYKIIIYEKNKVKYDNNVLKIWGEIKVDNCVDEASKKSL